MLHITMRLGVALRVLLAVAATWGSSASAAGPVPRNECANPPAGTIFCEDFENPQWRNANGWTGDKKNNTAYITDPANPGPAQDGSNRVLQVNVPPGRDGAFLFRKFTPTNRVWARWYIKYNAGFNLTDVNHGTGLQGGNTDLAFNSGQRPNGATSQVSFWTEYDASRGGKLFTYSYYHGMYQQCSNPNGGCFGDALPCVYDADNVTNYCEKPWDRPVGGRAASPTAVTERWYCVEQYVDIGDAMSDADAAAGRANGEFRSFIDGQMIAQASNLHIRTSTSFQPVSELLVQLFFGEANHNTAGQMFDNFVISTQRVGCGTATPDTVAPVVSYSGPRGAVTSPFAIQVTSDQACTMKYSTDVRPYAYTPVQTLFSSTGGTAHTTSIAVPSASTTYYFQCADAAGNVSNRLAVDLSAGGVPARVPRSPTNLRTQ